MNTNTNEPECCSWCFRRSSYSTTFQIRTRHFKRSRL